MTSFDNRENAFENKFAHDEKVDFTIEAHLSKLYGLWAAEKLGLDGADAQTYAMQVVEANLEEPGFQDIIRKVRADFDEKNLDISDHVMEAELDICLKKAKDQAENS